jgi:hypothetical protein
MVRVGIRRLLPRTSSGCPMLLQIIVHTTTTTPILPSFDDFAVSTQVDDEPEPLPLVSWTECITACDIIK